MFDTRVGSDGAWEVRDSGQVLVRITETFKRMAIDEVINLEVAYPDGSVATLTGTHEHPFWVEAEAAWVNLGELAEGDVLTTDGDGEAVVVGLTVRPDSHEVFNIEVAGPHNYFVRADGSDGPGVLVHNKGGSGGSGGGPPRMVPVSRWGKPGFWPNAWVTLGPTSPWNYFWSAKWAPGTGNSPRAPYDTGKNYFVPESRLRRAGCRDDPFWFIKNLLGQRLIR